MFWNFFQKFWSLINVLVCNWIFFKHSQETFLFHLDSIWLLRSINFALSKSSDTIWKIQEEFLNLTMRDSVSPISSVYHIINYEISLKYRNKINIQYWMGNFTPYHTQKKQRTTCVNVTKQTEYRNNFNNYNSVSIQ
jgi:hypothetical protein